MRSRNIKLGVLLVMLTLLIGSAHGGDLPGSSSVSWASPAEGRDINLDSWNPSDVLAEHPQRLEELRLRSGRAYDFGPERFAHLRTRRRAQVVAAQQTPVSVAQPVVQIAAFDGRVPIKQSEDGRAIGGTGIVIRPGGLILTPSHVIRGTDYNCQIPSSAEAPPADLLVILLSDPREPEKPPKPRYAVDLRGLSGDSLAQAIPAEALQLDLAIIWINKRIAGPEPPQNLEELDETVRNGTLQLADLDTPPNLRSFPLWDVAAVEEGQDVQLGGYPVVSRLPRIHFTEGAILEKRAEGTLVIDRAFSTFGSSGAALIEKRSGFVVGLVCGGQQLDTPAGKLWLAKGRVLDSQVQQLLDKVPDVRRRPVPRFTFTPAFPKPGETVTFDAADSFDPDGQIAKYEWDLDGDGEPDAKGVQIQQALSDDARVTLVVTDGDDLGAHRIQRVILDRREELQHTQQQCKPIQIGDLAFDTIQEAIDAAQPREMITVGPGTCQENLTITKSLTLRGAGRDQTILLGDGREPVIAVCPREETGESACPQLVEVTIEGFTVRNGLYALQVFANAKVTVGESDLLESVQQGVDAAFGAEVILIKNNISRNDEEGFVLEGGRAELQDNTIAENGDEGVLIKNLRTTFAFIPTEASLQRNMIESNRGFGAFVTQSASVQIAGGRISRNGSNGLEADEQAELEVMDTEISENARDGIHLFDATAEIRENAVISGNENAGLSVRGSAHASLTNTKVFANAARGLDGISVEDSAQMTLTNSQVFDNRGLSGIFVGDEAHVALTNSQVSSNEHDGLDVFGSAQVTLTNSQVSGHRNIGLSVGSLAQVTITNSQLSDNRGGGVSQAGLAQVIITTSQLSGNLHGLDIILGGTLTVVSNSQFENNSECGIAGSFVFGWGNRFSGNRRDTCGTDSGRLSRTLPPNPHSRPQVAVPQDVPTLQQAIDLVADGGTITIAPGTYDETLEVLDLEFVLKGSGKDQIHIAPKRRGSAIVVFSKTAKEMDLEGLTIGPSSGTGLDVGGAAILNLQNSQISGNAGTGLYAVDSAIVTLNDSAISNNKSRGLFAGGSAQLTLTNSQVSGNWHEGIDVDSATVTLINSQISGNRHDGLFVGGSATLTNSQVSGNWGCGLQVWGAHVSLIDSIVSGNLDAGLCVMGSAQVTLTNSKVSGNSLNGLSVEGSARVKVRSSTIEGNGTYSRCQEPERICNGVDVYGTWPVDVKENVQLTLIDSVIKDNIDWGIASFMKRCGYSRDSFTVREIFEGKNVIEGNNTSGNQDSMGNPGDHPWNRPDVPDGQVCLP